MGSPRELERQVSAAVRRAGLFGVQVRVVVACSGGPDSTALLRALNNIRVEHGLALHVAHLNHDFRGAEADHDAAFVQRLADRLGLPCSIDKRDPIAYQRERRISSFEQAAREMRYAFLSAVAAYTGAAAVALGHTADDQAETVLQHILRGSGLSGLRGMTEATGWPWPGEGPAPLLFRPTLGVSKAGTAAYCREIGQTYREDSGNYLWRFTRNRVRLDLMPRLARDYNPRVRDALLRLSRAAADEADYIEQQLDRTWGEMATEVDHTVSMDAGALADLHPALQRRALRRAYIASAGDSRALGEAHVDAMLSLLKTRRGGRTVDLPRGITARLESSVLRMGRRGVPLFKVPVQGEVTVPVPRSTGEYAETETSDWRLVLQAVDAAKQADLEAAAMGRNTAILRLDALGHAVTVRGRRPGDRFQPSGMTGTKKLQDFFTDLKVPRSQRDSIPLLVAKQGIAWVAGHRVAEWARAVEGQPAVWVCLSAGAG